MGVPTICEVLAAYARTAIEPVRSPATAAPAMTALDGFMVLFPFEVWVWIYSALQDKSHLERGFFLPWPEIFRGPMQKRETLDTR